MPKFDYDINSLIGTWDVTHIRGESGGYFSIKSPPVSDYFDETFIILNSNNTYVLDGWYGSLSGEYKADGKSVLLYDNNMLAAKCAISSMIDGHMEATITIMETMFTSDMKLLKR